MVVHHVYALLGVSDHKGQLLLLVVAMVMYNFQCHVRKNIAAEVGGAKRLHALTMVTVAAMLCPWALYQWATTKVGIFVNAAETVVLMQVELGVGVACSVFLCSIVLLADFYIEISRGNSQQQSPQQPQYHHFILLATTTSAFLLGSLLWAHPPWVVLTHDVSVGLLMATVLFFIGQFMLPHASTSSHYIITAAIMLSHPGKGSSRTLIGYSASGLPLYSGEVSPSNWVKESLHSILINPDSRRIFYFLCLNLVSRAHVCVRAYVYDMHVHLC